MFAPKPPGHKAHQRAVRAAWAQCRAKTSKSTDKKPKYDHTLNLPKTEFPMRAGAINREHMLQVRGTWFVLAPRSAWLSMATAHYTLLAAMQCNAGALHGVAVRMAAREQSRTAV
jgi:hypothetical protein